LIGEKVEVRLYVEHVEVWYAQKETERLEVVGVVKTEKGLV